MFQTLLTESAGFQKSVDGRVDTKLMTVNKDWKTALDTKQKERKTEIENVNQKFSKFTKDLEEFNTQIREQSPCSCS